MKKINKKGLFSVADNQKTLHKNLEFTATEQYKLLRTNLSFTLPEKEGCRIIGVTSSMRGEGKSTTAINLSYVLAESRKKVLLIDGDLRIPSIAKKIQIENTPGVTDFFRPGTAIDLATFKSSFRPNWYIIPSGTLPPNPSEILGSQRMSSLLKTFAEQFDYIIIDLPPVNLVSDALAISKYIDGIIVVIREEYTEKKELESCIRQLKLSNVNVLGCVMNETKNDKGYIGKYQKHYYKKHGDYQPASED